VFSKRKPASENLFSTLIKSGKTFLETVKCAANSLSCMIDRKEALKAVRERYLKEASTDKYATSDDMNLREIEISAISKHLFDGLKVLDIGCGNGYSTTSLAAIYESNFLGLDLSESMIEAAVQRSKGLKLNGSIQFRVANVLDMQIEPESFDVVITERLLINLPTWEDQMTAIKSIYSILKPNGRFLMMEATLQGVDKLNTLRQKVGLNPIAHSTKKNWWINRFNEERIGKFLGEYFHIEKIQKFGMYFFISRVIHPLIVAPEEPRFDSKINEVARKIALELDTDYDQLGHSAFFVLRKTQK